MPSKDDKASKSDTVTTASDLQQVQELYDLMVREKLDFLEVKQDEAVIRLSRYGGARPTMSYAPAAYHAPIATATPAPAPAPAAAADPTAASSNQTQITSPLAGVFYRASSPTNAAFVKEGDVVESGQTLCIVEAMKVMNEIKAEARGKIARIPAENARPVTAGQVLFLVEPA